ncbi:M57 family metalloprotease [Liquorilactobacillus satsumensis]|uniref:Peptidase M10 metallopeptidase domain-containing protein n=2 Tax=Liquorilactobacillus satsumensis TaxID=259059 RepID=A0A0R1V5V4_9LACO|nr:M57 family metalloprotease [Liquorilactobacillus satsumensis]KRL97083.1 hypothetical protein FD50_GL001631 [Liquorilactobacillus satsumensis DSM 16230 = JCM 12392]
MKFFRFTKLLLLGIAVVMLVKNPEYVALGKEWTFARIKQVSTLLQSSVQTATQQPASQSTTTADSSSESTRWNDTSQSSSASSAETSSATTSAATKSAQKTAQAVWSKKTATVYLEIPNNVSAQYREAWQAAITNWNKYKVFKLVTTTDKNKAEIVLTVENQSNTSMAGVTETKTLFSGLNGSQTLIHATAKLNMYYLDNYSMQRKVNTAEHELGHAMGLSHDDAETSVMQSQGSEYGIQETDVQHLKALYP